MASQARRLPRRFPIGSKYVVEGRGGGDGNLRVFSRYVALPDGRRIDLPADLIGATRPRSATPAPRRERGQSRRVARQGGRKNNAAEQEPGAPFGVV
jgi:hypothetical protein